MQIHTEITVSAPAARAWEILGEGFGNFSVWIAALESSTLKGELGVGAVRACRSKKFGPFSATKVEERLIEFDPEQQRYTYVFLSGLPSFVRYAQNTWSIESVNETQCVIRSHVVAQLSFWFRPFGWLIPLLMRRDMKSLCEELRHYIEHGKVHPRKARSI